MLGRYFRYLFENLDEGLFHSGSIYDKEEQRTTNYIYMAGSYRRNNRTSQKERAAANHQEVDTIPEKVDILVVGAYTVTYIRKFIDIVKHHKVDTVVLPYLAPIQRLVLMEESKSGSDEEKEIRRFLQDPYLFLKDFCINHIYFLYGNGTTINREPEELESGSHFEAADKETLRLIEEMEGSEIPVVRAGYIVENNWLFYFGVYGLDVWAFSDFTKEYFNDIENIPKESEEVREYYILQLKSFIREYLRRFGSSPATTIAMFHGPLHALPSENESLLTEKEFNRRERCEAWMKYQDEGKCTCAIRCMYKKDHDVIQNRKTGETQESRFGMLMLGNANLDSCLEEIFKRFRMIQNRIRGIGVPNCGNQEDWNHRILGLGSLKERIYWICEKHELTSPGVVSDIILASSHNRFLMLDENHGCCFTGYLHTKEDRL